MIRNRLIPSISAQFPFLGSECPPLPLSLSLSPSLPTLPNNCFCLAQHCGASKTAFAWAVEAIVHMAWFIMSVRVVPRAATLVFGYFISVRTRFVENVAHSLPENVASVQRARCERHGCCYVGGHLRRPTKASSVSCLLHAKFR